MEQKYWETTIRDFGYKPTTLDVEEDCASNLGPARWTLGGLPDYPAKYYGWGDPRLLSVHVSETIFNLWPDSPFSWISSTLLQHSNHSCYILHRVHCETSLLFATSSIPWSFLGQRDPMVASSWSVPWKPWKNNASSPCLKLYTDIKVVSQRSFFIQILLIE